MRREIIVGISTAVGTTFIVYLAGKVTQFPTVLVPSKAVVAFHAASCPDGWKEVGFTKGRVIVGVGEGKGLTPRHLLEEGGEEQHIYVSGGMLEVQPKIVTVLSDTAQRAEDLDEAAILKAREEAENAFHDKDAQIDYAKARAQLAETAAQLQTIQRLRKRAGRSPTERLAG